MIISMVKKLSCLGNGLKIISIVILIQAEEVLFDNIMIDKKMTFYFGI